MATQPKRCSVTELKRPVARETFQAPECPGHIQGEARAEWKRVAEMLERHRLITELDRAALALYCGAYGRWCDAEAKILALKAEGREALVDRDGNNPQINLYVVIARQAMADVNTYSQQLGLAPMARSRMNRHGKGAYELAEKSTHKNYFS